MDPHFYGYEHACVLADHPDYPGIRTPRDLFYALTRVWCAQTCAPRMRDRWSTDDPTVGQCSVTAFLAQDIFGGTVYGIPLQDGGFHCYNVVGDCLFDLTSEQFGDKALCYEDNPEQLREIHFSRDEKRVRYEYLKAQLHRLCMEQSR